MPMTQAVLAPIRVEREQTHELGGEHTTGGQQGGHAEQGPVTLGPPRRCRAAASRIGPRSGRPGIGECVDQAVEVEHRSDVIT